MARAFDRRITLGRLLQTEPDIRPYLAAIIVAALQRAREAITVPFGVKINEVTQEEFDKHLMELATKTYPTYGILESLRKTEATPE